MALKSPESASRVESVSSLACARNQHPNKLKIDAQLVAGLSVVTGELPGGGHRIVLTSAPHKYNNDRKLHINSIHGYQTKLPDRVDDRNKLCANLLTQRGNPVIRCDGGQRQRFHRDILPELRVDEVQVEVKKWTGFSDRHIEDMFANMQTTKRAKAVIDSEPKATTATAAAAATTSDTETVDKKERPQKANPLKKLFEAQLKRSCCKRGQTGKNAQLTETVASKYEPVKSEATSPKRAARNRPRAKKGSTDESSSEESQAFDTDDVNVDRIVAPKMEVVTNPPKGQFHDLRTPPRIRSTKPLARMKEKLSVKKVEVAGSSSHVVDGHDEESTSDCQVSGETIKAELDEEDNEVIVPKSLARRMASRRLAAQDNELPPAKAQRRSSNPSPRRGHGSKVRAGPPSEDQVTVSKQVSKAPHVVSDDSDESNTGDRDRESAKYAPNQRRGTAQRTAYATTRKKTASKSRGSRQKTMDTFFKRD